MDQFEGHSLHVYSNEFLEKCGLNDESTFEEVKEQILWGTYGKPASFLNFEWKRLKDCSEDHLKAIMLQQHIPELTRVIIRSILKDKYKEKTKTLLGSRWRRADYDFDKSNYNGYTVIVITNTAHKHPAHPEQVIYKGDNGNIWSMPLTDWPGNLIPE